MDTALRHHSSVCSRRLGSGGLAAWRCLRWCTVVALILGLMTGMQPCLAARAASIAAEQAAHPLHGMNDQLGEVKPRTQQQQAGTVGSSSGRRRQGGGIRLLGTTHQGYLDVSPEEGSKMFFTYFEAKEATDDVATRPIILWLQVRSGRHAVRRRGGVPSRWACARGVGHRIRWVQGGVLRACPVHVCSLGRTHCLVNSAGHGTTCCAQHST